MQSYKLTKKDYTIDKTSEPVGTMFSYVSQGEYKNRKTNEKKPVTIKECMGDGELQRLKQEIGILEKIANFVSANPDENSNYLIKYYGSRFFKNILGLKEGHLVMEYADGGDLRSWIDNSDVTDWTVKFPIICGTARSLYYVHSIKIIHCGIDSSSFLLKNENGRLIPKLASFECAMNEDADSAYGCATRYSAPEILSTNSLLFNNNLQTYTYKSDIYSLGLVFWEVAALSTIYYCSKLDYQVKKHVVDYQKRDYFPKGCPLMLWYLINWMWQQKPEDRPAIEQVLEQLSNELDTISSNLKQIMLSFEIHNLAKAILKKIIKDISHNSELSNNPWKEILNYDEKLNIFSDILSKKLAIFVSDDYILSLSNFRKNCLSDSIANIFISEYKRSYPPCEHRFDCINWLKTIFGEEEKYANFAKFRLERNIFLGIENSIENDVKKYSAVKQVLEKFSIFEPLRETSKLKEIVSISIDNNKWTI